MEPTDPRQFQALAQGATSQLDFDQTNWDIPQFLPLGQITTPARMHTVTLTAPEAPIELAQGPSLDVDRIDFVDPLTRRVMTGAQFLDRRLCCDALLVYADDTVRYETYRNAIGPSDRHIIHSCTKSLTTLMVGVAVADGLLDPSATLGSYVPELAEVEAFDGVTLQHGLDMTTGIRSEEHYEDPDSMYWRYAKAVGYYGSDPEAAGALGFAIDNLTERAEQPGSRFNYTSPVTNLLAICLERVYGRPAPELYEQFIYSRIGAENDALLNCDRFGSPIVEGHLNLTLRDFVRWALLVLHDGKNLDGDQVVPAEWIIETCSPSPRRREAFASSEYGDMFSTGEYHNQTWLLDPGAGQVAMLGIHGQFAYLDRSRQILIAAMSSYPTQVDPLAVAIMADLWKRISDEL